MATSVATLAAIARNKAWLETFGKPWVETRLRDTFGFDKDSKLIMAVDAMINPAFAGVVGQVTPLLSGVVSVVVSNFGFPGYVAKVYVEEFSRLLTERLKAKKSGKLSEADLEAIHAEVMTKVDAMEFVVAPARAVGPATEIHDKDKAPAVNPQEGARPGKRRPRSRVGGAQDGDGQAVRRVPGAPARRGQGRGREESREGGDSSPSSSWSASSTTRPIRRKRWPWSVANQPPRGGFANSGHARGLNRE